MNMLWTNRNFRRLIVWSSWRCITEREEAFVVFSFPRPWPVSKKGRTSGKKSGKATEFANVCSCTSSRATRASESTTKDRRFAQTSLDYERTSFLPLFPRIFFITPTSLLHWWNKIPYGLYNWQKKNVYDIKAVVSQPARLEFDFLPRNARPVSTKRFEFRPNSRRRIRHRSVSIVGHAWVWKRLHRIYVESWVVTGQGRLVACLAGYSWYVSSQEPFQLTRCAHYSCMWSVENGMADGRVRVLRCRSI